MKKVISSILTLVGAALLVFAIALPTYVVPKGKVIPLDVVSLTPTEIVESNLMDSAAIAENKPVKGKENLPECREETKQLKCFIWTDVKLQSQRFITAEEPANDDVVTFNAAQTLFRTDREEPHNLLNATVDRVTLDRKTQQPVKDPIATFDLNAPAASSGSDVKAAIGPNVREGITYQFPMGTDRKSYQYFDLNSQTTNPIDYVGEEEISGYTVYRFEQTLAPINLYERLKEALNEDGELSEGDEATLASLRLSFPADVWGIDKGEENPNVEMDRYYTVNRTIWVEPRTGAIMNGREEIWQYYAQDQAEADSFTEESKRKEEIANPTRTATYFPGEWNDQARAGQLKKVEEGVGAMRTMGTIVPWILGPLGVILLIIGFVIALRSGKNS